MTNDGVPYHLVSLFLAQSVRLRSLQGSFSNLSVTSSSSKLILQPFRRFTYATAHSPTLPLLYLSHSSFSNPSFASSTSQLILQPFFRFSYVTAHSPTFPSLYLRHNSFSNSSFASSTSQLILQPFFRYSVTGSSLTPPGEPPPWVSVSQFSLDMIWFVSFSKKVIVLISNLL